MIVHFVDGTYELFRHFYGLRRFTKGKDRPYGAVGGVLQTVLNMIENGDTYLGVATDHVIESFRNRLWPDYKTGGANSASSHVTPVRPRGAALRGRNARAAAALSSAPPRPRMLASHRASAASRPS